MQELELIKGCIFFSDLKDFTLKTSLLTQKQINKILDDQENIFIKNLSKYNWELIKTIWDSYMVFFASTIDALNYAVEIQKEVNLYNSDKSIILHKLEVKISLDYWTLSKKQTNLWVDYFWDTVNLASRVLSKTIENKIFLTDKFYNEVSNNTTNYQFSFIWKTVFKWILYEVWVYEVLFSQEDIVNFKNNNYQKVDFYDTLVDEKIKKRVKNIDELIFRYACINAILWIQPIPFLDIYSSVPVYIFLIKNIAKEYNIKIETSEIKDILWVVFSSIWWAFLTTQLIVWVSKIWLIWVWVFIIIPLNFWVSYAIWKIINRYFYSKIKNIEFTNNDIKELFISTKDIQSKYAKNHKKEIIEKWKLFKTDYEKMISNSTKEIEAIVLNLKKFLKSWKISKNK